MAEIRIGHKIFVVPDKGSPCELWKGYFTQLRQAVGREHAKRIWLITWSKHGSTVCTTNANFNAWLKRHNLDVSNAATRAVADLSQMGSNVLGLGKSLTKIVSIGVPVLLGGGLILTLYFIFKTAKTVQPADLISLNPGSKMLLP